MHLPLQECLAHIGERSVVASCMVDDARMKVQLRLADAAEVCLQPENKLLPGYAIEPRILGRGW